MEYTYNKQKKLVKYLKTYVWKNNFFLTGSIQEVMKTLNDLSEEYNTVEEMIKSYLH